MIARKKLNSMVCGVGHSEMRMNEEIFEFYCLPVKHCEMAMIERKNRNLFSAALSIAR